ncbi:iron-containing alcohol dehydrogenase [Hwanghaeella grinnelliae]|uniref:Alcohol dehydrogenase 2 n=1 Tax=Hwanghaeella grinnelliae TaxID=2500179 RepID=A0A3S2VNF1_9PROT|nr:iron-containing alcohol dehydrogenase [Hwanghaeella grinnelliae]RVU37799.1 iron-containing alcohol dehydrogenase [Hwanghaeella grinnelliae]
MQANWSYPTTIWFGAGRIEGLPEACRSAGMERPLLVTDAGLADLPITTQTLDILDKAGMGRGMFSGVDSNPTDKNLAAGIEVFKAGGHDGVIAFGGGSALDVGKLIAFQADQVRPVWDFEDIGDWWTRANAEVIWPIIAVPTTSGTGSEVGRAGVVTNTEAEVKKVIFHPKMLPAIVISDPELTVGLPPHITAGTGMDAFVHNLEAYCAPTYHPMSEGIAVEGMRLVKEYLPRAYAKGDDIEARGHMMSAAAMGAVAFQKGLGGVHSLSHPAGVLYHTHHGLTNAVYLPYVLAFNRPAIEGKIERLSAWLGIDGGFDGFMKYVLDLRSDLGIAHTSKEIGIDDTQTERMAAMAVVDPTAGGNPIPLTEEICCDLYRRALAGNV